MFSPEQARRFYDRFGIKQDTQSFYENPALDKLVEFGDFENAHDIVEFGCGRRLPTHRSSPIYFRATVENQKEADGCVMGHTFGDPRSPLLKTRW